MTMIPTAERISPLPSLLLRSHLWSLMNEIRLPHDYDLIRNSSATKRSYISSLAHNYTLCVIFWKKYVQRRPNATTEIVVFTKVYVERIFHFFCFQGWSMGACFLHLLREDHRSSLKVNFFCRNGFHFTPQFLRLLWGHMKAKPVNLSCQPTEKEGNHSKKKIFCLRRV